MSDLTRLQEGLRYPFPEAPEFGALIEIATDIFWLRLPLPMALDHVNVYLLRDPDGWTIVDTGMGSRKTKAIWQSLIDGPLACQSIARVIVTHHHPDHVGLAGWFQTEFGAELIMTRTAWLMARMLVLDVQDLPVPETLTFWRRAGMDPVILEERAKGKPFNFADTVHPMPLGYSRIQEGDVLTLAGRKWTVHIGNGHAPEHATLWCDDAPLVIAGDQIISSISPNLGVYATEPDADPVGEWLEACERLARYATPDHLVLSGHKLPFIGLPHRFQQMITNHHHALDRLYEYLETPRTAAECFSCLFKRHIGADEYGLALVEAVAHLNTLYRSGRAKRQLDENGALRYSRP